ncbi:lysophospholipid acyltransferase family protein [Luteibaculum oceani]|uniref:1-acyl-sn-glycerol-3-phosphate acyltransferase n=1 Tax=Luteibaculum oceani TaxID=1294296 RepID=A0A5C6V499_9FLAO|nr:lysophospholipid acyltransferase family protein [Luteibaculum oceani]TXC78528.1 1-acyl-sn-glycerol-3-phosphate acyltransferase [Luteibaculum oceani]
MLKKDPFGYYFFLKRFLILTLGTLTWFRYRVYNKVDISGMEELEKLSEKGVLFVANHQTYFAETILLYHVFSAHKNGIRNKLPLPWYLLNPKVRLYFVAALETMKAGFIPKLFAYAGSISIKRTWREAGKNINRKVDLKDISNIGTALDFGWVITFPQGTTTPFVPGRRGTAHIIKKYNPVVVPVVVDGFRRAFDKKGLFLKKTNTTLKVTFKEPLQFSENENAEEIIDKIMQAIEQRPIPPAVANL